MCRYPPPSLGTELGSAPSLESERWPIAAAGKCHNGQKPTFCYRSHWWCAAWVSMWRIFRNRTWDPRIASSWKSVPSPFMQLCHSLDRSHGTYYYGRETYHPTLPRMIKLNLNQSHQLIYDSQWCFLRERNRGVPLAPPVSVSSNISTAV